MHRNYDIHVLVHSTPVLSLQAHHCRARSDRETITSTPALPLMLKQTCNVAHTCKIDTTRMLRGDFFLVNGSLRVSAHGRLPVQSDMCMAILTSLSKHQKHTSSLTLPLGRPEER